MHSSAQAAIDRGRESFVRTPDGLDLSVREWGDPAGPEIVFIHGLAQCHLSFARQTSSFLAKRYRLIAFDLRGHGNSQKPTEAHFYQQSLAWADDIKAVIEAKQLRRPVLVGWSLGGRVLRQYLMHYGDEKLSGINFLATRPIEESSIVGPGSLAMVGSEKLDFADRLQAEIDFLLDCYAKPPDQRDLLIAVAYNLMFPRAIRDAIAGWSTDINATRATLAKLSLPVLVTHGRLDRLILPEAAEMTVDASRNARISWYETCGHSPFYEDAERYNRELDAFVSEAWRG